MVEEIVVKSAYVLGVYGGLFDLLARVWGEDSGVACFFRALLFVHLVCVVRPELKEECFEVVPIQ